MKANGAPEKLYLLPNGLISFCRNTDEDVVYTHTDAFIEKALKFLDGCIPDYINLKHANVDTFMDVDNEKFIEDFRNYMKGE